MFLMHLPHSKSELVFGAGVGRQRGRMTGSTNLKLCLPKRKTVPRIRSSALQNERWFHKFGALPCKMNDKFHEFGALRCKMEGGGERGVAGPRCGLAVTDPQAVLDPRGETGCAACGWTALMSSRGTPALEASALEESALEESALEESALEASALEESAPRPEDADGRSGVASVVFFLLLGIS